MYKIFKYPCGYDGNKMVWWGMFPEGKIIRTEKVEDETYKGYWAWVIVKVGDPAIRREFQFVEQTVSGNIDKTPLGLLESQFRYICSDATINGVVCIDGLTYLVGNKIDPEKYGFYKAKTIEILGFKTGQEMPDDIESYRYLGFAKFVIKQELAVYYFIKD